MYYDFSEKVSSIAPHRILAVFRGEKEGALKLGFLLEDEENIKQIRFHLCKNFENGVFKYIDEAVKDGYKRLLLPSRSSAMAVSSGQTRPSPPARATMSSVATAPAAECVRGLSFNRNLGFFPGLFL